MKKKEIVSVYEVTDLKTGGMWREFVKGDGQSAIRFLRKQYPRFSKFVLEGFEIDGTFIYLKLEGRDGFNKTIRKNTK